MKNSGEKILTFLKKNAVYLVLAFCILAIGLSAMFAIISENSRIENDANLPSVDVDGDANGGENNGDNPDETPQEPTVTEINFIMPVENATAVTEYSETMVYNSTLERYNAHKAVDFYAEEGAPVLAVYDGTVESVTNSLLKGYTVVINHGNGLKTVYNSLADEEVKEGQKVKQGDKIGSVSTTNRQEYKSGAHLHFEVEENGEIINPEKYLDLDNK